MQEQWIQWEPVTGLEGKYSVKTMTDDFDGLVVILSLDNNSDFEIKLACKPYAEAYRQNSENFRLTTLSSQLSQQYGDNFHHNWTFFKIVDSEYLAWLDKESGTISSYYKCEHFCILAHNAIIDIATCWEPEIYIISAPQEL